MTPSDGLPGVDGRRPLAVMVLVRAVLILLGGVASTGSCTQLAECLRAALEMLNRGTATILVSP